jgi:hypothetical protein
MEITLSCGLSVFFDEADADAVLSRTWTVLRCKRDTKLYAANWLVIEGKKHCLLMHRMLLAPPSDMVVDHIDSNGLNNRRYNLRVCTVQQNNHNKRHDPDRNQHGVTGLRFLAEHSCWVGRIRCGTRNFSKRFDTKDEAAWWIERKRVELHGEFAYSPGNDHRVT